MKDDAMQIHAMQIHAMQIRPWFNENENENDSRFRCLKKRHFSFQSII